MLGKRHMPLLSWCTKPLVAIPNMSVSGSVRSFSVLLCQIAANIAEGYRRDGMKDKLHFLNIAQSSLEECRYYILLSHDLGYITIDTYNILNESIEVTSKLLNAYYRGIKARNVL